MLAHAPEVEELGKDPFAGDAEGEVLGVVHEGTRVVRRVDHDGARVVVERHVPGGRHHVGPAFELRGDEHRPAEVEELAGLRRSDGDEFGLRHGEILR